MFKCFKCSGFVNVSTCGAVMNLQCDAHSFKVLHTWAVLWHIYPVLLLSFADLSGSVHRLPGVHVLWLETWPIAHLYFVSALWDNGCSSKGKHLNADTYWWAHNSIKVTGELVISSVAWTLGFTATWDAYVCILCGLGDTTQGLQEINTRLEQQLDVRQRQNAWGHCKQHLMPKTTEWYLWSIDSIKFREQVSISWKRELLFS